jgi:hypothetical protein
VSRDTMLEAIFKDIVNGILITRFTLIRLLICYIRLELVKLFNA